jgi:hypothetical protein
MGAQQRAPEALWPGGAGQTWSSREAIAALATAGSEDRAAGTRTHPQAEPVGLVPPTVVRLEGSLAHESSPKAGAALGRPIRREDHRRSPRRLPWAMTAPGRTSPRYARPAEGVKPADRPGGTRLPRSGRNPVDNVLPDPARQDYGRASNGTGEPSYLCTGCGQLCGRACGRGPVRPVPPPGVKWRLAPAAARARTPRRPCDGRRR